MAKLKLMRLFTLNFWDSVFNTLMHTSKRFPLSVISLLLLALLVFSEVHDFNLFDNKLSEKLALLFSGGFLWFSSATLLCENRNWIGFKKYLFLFLIYLVYCWRIYLDPKVTLELILLLGALLLTLSFFPRLFRGADNSSSWYFNFQIIAGIAFALLAAVIFSGGLSLILVSVGYLFEVDIKAELYGDAWIIGMILFAPMYVLAQLPEQFDFESEDCKFPKGVHFIFNFVMVPLALIFMVILYAYFIKILLQWNLPHGHLGWMISVFGIIGILTHLAIYPVHKNNKPLMGWFYRNFYRIMIVPLTLLVVAIGVRVQQYGVTEKRYIIVLCSVWFAWLIINNLFRREKFKLTTVTISLAVLLFFGSFGPWGIKQFSISSQFSQFQKILRQTDMLKDGKIQPPQQPLDKKTQQSLSSIADYLARHDSIELFRPLINDSKAFDKALDCVPEKSCRSRNVTKLLSLMGTEYIDHWNYNRNQQTIITVKTVGNGYSYSMLPISKGYDYIIPLNWLYPSSTGSIVPWDKDADSPQLKLQLTHDGIFTLSSENMQSIIFDLMTFSKQFPQNRTTVIESENQRKMVLTEANKQLTITLFLTQVTFSSHTAKNQIKNLIGNLLIKMKDDEAFSGKLSPTIEDNQKIIP